MLALSGAMFSVCHRLLESFRSFTVRSRSDSRHCFRWHFLVLLASHKSWHHARRLVSFGTNLGCSAAPT
jgi:hypothetical protein